MLSIEMARAIDADRNREIEAALKRRRLLEPDEAPDEPPGSIRVGLPLTTWSRPPTRPKRLAATEQPSHCVAVDCCP